MHFEPFQTYHVYNRGNNKQPIFFTQANYIYFLNKIKTEWKSYADILCYCLMPNHFHLMLIPKEEGCKNVVLAGKETHLQNLSKSIGKTLSSYTKAINIQNNTTGNLFQKKTKAKLLNEQAGVVKNFSTQEYILTCFNYIHQNPLKTKLVNHLSDWPFSSYLNYYYHRKEDICNKNLAFQFIGISNKDLEIDFNYELNDEIIEGIF